MITKLNIHIIVSCVLFLVSCTSTTSVPLANPKSNDTLDAQQALTDFLKNLHERNFEEAAKLYGGSYEVLIDQNPGIDPSTHSILLNNACTINGYQCLEIKSVVPDRELSAKEFTFKVEFRKPDGTLFILGPCCGGNETDSPPQSLFIFNVEKAENGNFLVMDLPPYMP